MTNAQLESFLPEILETEARAMLASIGTAPLLKADFQKLDVAQSEKAVAYITSFLHQCYREGHLKFAVSNMETSLVGYALMFENPAPHTPRYLHNLYVKPEFRKNGVGRRMLKTLIDDQRGVTLLSPLETVGFFERSGLKLISEFRTNSDPAFRLSKGLYSGLFLLGDKGHAGAAPIVLLNDEDLREILNLNAPTLN